MVDGRTPKPRRGISKPLGSLIVELMVVAILENRICGDGEGKLEVGWRGMELEMQVGRVGCAFLYPVLLTTTHANARVYCSHPIISSPSRAHSTDFFLGSLALLAA